MKLKKKQKKNIYNKKSTIKNEIEKLTREKTECHKKKISEEAAVLKCKKKRYRILRIFAKNLKVTKPL